MEDKDKSFPLDNINWGKDDLEKGKGEDIQKSSLPDFQYTPATPSTPPAKEAESVNSDSGE